MEVDNIRNANVSQLVPENAKEFFDYKMAWDMIEHNMEELIFEWFGCPDEDDYWVFDDVSLDWYDYSYELEEVENDWVPTKEQLQKTADFGFSRCWINYKDGTEIHCYFKDDEIHIGKRKEGIRKPIQ